MGIGHSGVMPGHIGVPSVVMPPQSQQVGPTSIGPMTQVTMSHVPQPGAPPPPPQMMPVTSQPQYATLPHSR